MRRPPVLLLAAALASCDRCAGSTSAPSDAAPPTRDAATSASAAPRAALSPADEAAEEVRQRAEVPAVGWASFRIDGEDEGAVGMGDIERDEPATTDTAFEAASIAKTVIATCVMQLVEERVLSLDADVSRYVGFPVRHPKDKRAITLRHLLTHTSSIVDLPPSGAAGGVTLSDFLGGYFDAGSAGVFLDAPPGTEPVYSNVGASLAALAVEHVTGKRFAEQAQARVFAPLGMSRTAFGRARLPAGTRIAAPYVARGPQFTRLAVASHALYPVVDLFSTARDLARFGRAILRRGELDGVRVLSRGSVDAMLAVQLPRAAPDDALGWQLRTIGGRRVVGHEGEDAGASTGFYLDRSAGVGALVLTNGDAFRSGADERGAAVFDLLRDLLDASAPDAGTIRSRHAD